MKQDWQEFMLWIAPIIGIVGFVCMIAAFAIIIAMMFKL